MESATPNAEGEIEWVDDGILPLEIDLPPTAETHAMVLQLLQRNHPKIVGTRYSRRNQLPPAPIPYPKHKLIPKTPLFTEIQDMLESGQKHERIPLNGHPHFYCHEHPDEFDHNLSVGNYSLYDKSCKIKYIAAIPWTPTEVASKYIQLCEIRAGKKLTQQYSVRRDTNRSHPVIFFAGRYEGDLAYIDMNHAYWQILCPTTIDMEYEPDYQEIGSHGHIPYVQPDEFTLWKESRLVLNSLFNYQFGKIWDKENKVIRRSSFSSRFYRPYNYTYILDVMRAIVYDVRDKFTIHHWLTDAPIVNANDANSVLEFLWERWKISARIEAIGPGDSKGLNIYKVGDKKTKHFYTANETPVHDNKMAACNVEGLRKERLRLLEGYYHELWVPSPTSVQRFTANAIPMEIVKMTNKPSRPSNENRNFWKE